MKKRFLAIILVMAMFVIVLAGCSSNGDPAPTPATGNQSNTSTPSDGGSSSDGTDGGDISFPLAEPYTVNAFAFSTPGEEIDKTLTMQTMQEMTNVIWNFTLASEAELMEKMLLSFNSGDYYDVYIKSGIDAATTAQFARQGIIIPLNDLIDQYMPNLKAALNEENVWTSVTSGDGNIYSLPQLLGPGIASPSYFINQDWLNAVGMSMPKTENEFLEVLRAFRDQNPGDGGDEVYPMFMPAGALAYWLPYFGMPIDWNTSSYFDISAGEITYIYTCDRYNNLLRFMQNAYAEKLINQNTYTATWDDMGAYGATRDVMGMFPTWGAYLTVGDRHESFPMLMPFQPNSFPTSDGVGYGALVITDNCERPDIIASWADILYDETGGRLAAMGVEGITYELHSDGFYDWIGDDITTVRHTNTLSGYQNAPYRDPRLYNEGTRDEFELFLWKDRQTLLNDYRAAPPPPLSWTDDELRDKSTLLADIGPYVAEYEAMVITGEYNLDATWNDYITTLNNMGLERLLAIDRAAYDRWLAEYR